MPTYAGWRRSITSDTGVVIPNAQIEVFDAGALTKPTLYADPEGVTELTNPFDADAEGFAEFYVAGGFYRVEAGAEGAEGIWDWVAIGTAQGFDQGDVVVPSDLAAVATSGDHVDLINKGTNTHAQIDAHIASTSNPHDTTLSNLDDTGTVNYTNRHCLVGNGTQYVSRALVEADISDLGAYITGVDWGDVGGTLSNQTDLQSALDAKADTSSLGAAATSNDHGDLDNVGTNTHAQIDSHIADESEGIHGSTVAATANKLVHRDANGRAKIADPSVDADIANKGYVDSTVGSGMSVKNSLEIDSGSAQLVGDESSPDTYSAYGLAGGTRGFIRTHNLLTAAQAAFKLSADLTVDSAADDAILFTSAASAVFGAFDSSYIDLGIYSTDYITATSGNGGAFQVTAFVQKSGAGTVNIRVVKTGSAQIGANPTLELSGAGVFPIVFNCYIPGQQGGINLEVEHVSGSNTITDYSHISVVRTAGTLII